MITSYEELLIEYDNKVTIIEKKFKSKAKGLCKGNKIGISNELSTSVEKRCVLAEELGHIHLTVGDITNLNNVCNIKQEIIARRWGHSKILPLCKLTNAIKKGLCTKYELLEYLNVTEEFFDEAISHYKQKYGVSVNLKNYILILEPTFSIVNTPSSTEDTPLEIT